MNSIELRFSADQIQEMQESILRELRKEIGSKMLQATSPHLLARRGRGRPSLFEDRKVAKNLTFDRRIANQGSLVAKKKGMSFSSWIEALAHDAICREIELPTVANESHQRSVSDFLSDRFNAELDLSDVGDHFVTCGEIYALYLEWCQANGGLTFYKSQSAFIRCVLRLRPEWAEAKQRRWVGSERPYVFQGLTLKEAAHE